MGRSRDIAASTATNETSFVNVTGDTMTGNLAINNASGSQVTLHRPDTTIANDDLYGQIIMSGDDADTNASGTRGYIRGRSRGSGGGLKMEFGTAGGGVAMGADPRMTINADGYVTMPSQVSFKAHGQDNAYITTSPLGFPSLTGRGAHNIGNHYNTANSTFTAPISGRYLFHVHVGIVRMTSTGGYIYPNLEVNSASIMYTYNNQSFSNSGSWNQYANSHMTQIVSLAANDVVRVTVQWGSADYYNGPGELSFAGCLLG